MESRDYNRAADGFEEALSIARQSGYKRGSSVYLLNLAQAERYLAEYPKARAHLAESLAIGRKLGYREVVVEVLYTAAALATSVGDYGWAGGLIGVAQREGDFGHVVEESSRDEYEFTMSSLRQNLRADGMQEAIAAGRVMTLDAAAEYLQVVPASRTTREPDAS
jgi:tetratricopeptide (TPR) repeat protein